MNATNYYVSTTRLVLQADPSQPSSWHHLYTALPTLRNSLSCTVCENLLTEPYTPEETTCEHHVCKSCKGGAKKLRPSCSWCKDYSKYTENVQLRILIQNYKKLCGLIKITSLFGHIIKNSEHGNLIRDIIRESEGEKIPQPLHVDNLRPAVASKDNRKPTTATNNTAAKVTEDAETPRTIEDDVKSPPAKRANTSEGRETRRISAGRPSTVVAEVKVEEVKQEPEDYEVDEVEPVDEIISSPYSKFKHKSTTSATLTAAAITKADLSSRFSETQPTPKASPASSPLSSSPPPSASSVSSPSVSRAPSGVRKIRSEAFILDPFKGKADLPQGKRTDSTHKTPKQTADVTVTKQTLLSDYGISSSPKVSKVEETSKVTEATEPQVSAAIRRKAAGCRCGNATLCPGKLTCCGQRCPCYVDNLACTDCKCKGCRNPHRPGGGKVRPPLPFVKNMQIVFPKEQATVRIPVTLSSGSISLRGIDLSQLPILNLDSSCKTSSTATPTVSVISLLNKSSGGGSSQSSRRSSAIYKQ